MHNALRTHGVLVCLLVAACRGDARTDGSGSDTVSTPPAMNAAPPAVEGLPKLRPVDQADAGLIAFRTQVLAALQRRDTVFLYSMLAPEIRNSFGGDDSIAGFKRLWQPAKAESRIWDALTRALSMGGTLTDSTFTFPYVYALWPDSIDAFQHVAITGEQVIAHAAADEQSPAVATLSNDIVPVESWQDLGEHGVATRASWAQIRLPGGARAFVNGLNAYSPVSWRGFFQKRDGRWVLITFVAGD